MTDTSALPPYTYVTFTVDPTKTRLSISFHTAELETRASVIDGRRPIFALSTIEANVSVSTTGAGLVTTADVDLARQIFDSAARYLADCERLYTGTAADQAA
ncbi:hypothetical protein J5X84_43405 [Streptosporangiaceae bacterium NEAU-GS5]|nr:hypothetical protein [Streptosporangiaceae bacterium NEAU-GS5]